MNKRILIADEDNGLTAQLNGFLSTKGFESTITNSGTEVLQLTKQGNFGLIILEVSLQDLDGYSICRLLRAEGITTPVIFLTEKTSEIHAVIGLEVGAQDYLRKPVQINELFARIELQLKRNQAKLLKKINLADLEIDIERRTVKQNGQIKELTSKEFQLLYALANCPNKVFSRSELLSNVWGYSDSIPTRTVDLHMSYLRRKLEENPKRPKLLKTIRGGGYFLDCE